MTLNVSVHYRFEMMKFAILQQIDYVNLKQNKTKQSFTKLNANQDFFW